MSTTYRQEQINARAIAARDVAAQALYRAELAVHDADGTGVAEWISAAQNRLQEAVLRYRAQLINDQTHDHLRQRATSTVSWSRLPV